MKDYDEILFLDWDCKFIGELDNDFYKLLKKETTYKYLFIPKSLDWMIEKTQNQNINPFCKT